jgi:HEAT repeat protein
MSRNRWRALEAKFEQLDQVRDDPTSGGALDLLREALGDKSNLVAARGAKLIADLEVAGLDEDLVRAFERFLRDPGKTDGTCQAKTAIMDALRRKGYGDPEIFLRGIRYVQLEPAYGGPVDTAVDLRCLAALGLVGTNDPRTMIELAHLLVDAEPRARIGAVRAMASSGREAAIPLLHFKVLSGDAEPEVAGECFDALLDLSPEDSLPFVAGFLRDRDPAICEAAALALGESRIAAGLGFLTATLEDVGGPDIEPTLLLAIAMIRNEEAMEFLLGLIRDAPSRRAAGAVTALGTYRYDDELRRRVQDAADTRGDAKLSQAVEEAFG